MECAGLGYVDQRHKPDVVVRWPGQEPTSETHDHRAEAIAL